MSSLEFDTAGEPISLCPVHPKLLEFFDENGSIDVRLRASG